MAPVLQFENVAAGYPGHPVLRDVSFAVRPGEFVCLIGPSGAGKTTLLRLAAGLERPLSGTIRLDGRGVAGDGGWVPPERRRVGFVFQDFALFPHLTVLQNVLFGMERKDRDAATGWLKRVEMADFSARRPHQLSGGQKQRVALVRALARQPQLLLLDEPFSGLDAGLRPSVRQETRQLARDTGTATLMVTHDLEEALELADRILILRGGVVTEAQHSRTCPCWNIPGACTELRRALAPVVAVA